MTVEHVSKQIVLAGRYALAAMSRLLAALWAFSRGRRFRCQAEQVLDETCPSYEDRFLCVSMCGGVRVPCDNLDTDVRVELLDVTEGHACAEPVLAAEPQWQRSHSPVFHYQAHNGVIPSRHFVLPKPVSVVKIPLHQLRFARRGRRKIQVQVAIVSRDHQQVFAQAQTCTEYVARYDGFVEMQERHEAVLRAAVELACAAVEQPYVQKAADLIGDWIAEKTQHFTPRSSLTEPLDRLMSPEGVLDTAAACECVLAWGRKSDAGATMDLVLQVAALHPAPTDRQETLLWSLAEQLGIAEQRFQVSCQKWLVTDHCSARWAPLLLGIRDRLTPDALRARLNDQYRKWNARVTHADPDVRRQADIILSTIAEVRSQQGAVLSH